MLFLTQQAHFGFIEWGMFWLLSAGGMAMAHFRQRIFGFMPLISVAATIWMLAVCPSTPETFGLAALAFAALHAGGGYMLQQRSQRPLLWALPVGASMLGIFLTGYFRLHAVITEDWVWSGLARIMASAATLSVTLLKPLPVLRQRWVALPHR